MNEWMNEYVSMYFDFLFYSFYFIKYKTSHLSTTIEQSPLIAHLDQ